MQTAIRPIAIISFHECLSRTGFLARCLVETLRRSSRKGEAPAGPQQPDRPQLAARQVRRDHATLSGVDRRTDPPSF